MGKGEIARYEHLLFPFSHIVFKRLVDVKAEPDCSVGSVVDLRTGGSHRCPLFRQWFCGKATSGLEGILCRVLVKRPPGKHG